MCRDSAQPTSEVMSSSRKSKPQFYGSFVHKLLQAADAGQRAEDLTRTSGHLGPRGLNQDQPRKETKPISCRTSQSQERPNPPTPQKRQTKTPIRVRKAEKGEPASEFTSSTALVESAILRSRQDQETDHLSHADRKGDKTPPETVYSSSLPLQQENSSQEKPSSSSDPEDQEGVNNNRQRDMKQEFAREVKAERNLWARRDVAEMHQRKLDKEVKKLAAESRPCRDRLAVFSDVFDDVCEGSPVFGGILREIKTEYDLYVNHLMASQSSLPNTSPKASLTDLSTSKVTEMELDEAEKEVYKLERDAKRALEEKQRVQNELQNIPAIRGPEDTDLTCLQDGASGCTDCIQVRRLQVLNVLKEIQEMEDEMKNQMVSRVTTTATERCIKDQMTEIVKLIASNQRLRATTKDLEDKINMVLNREKASKSIRKMLWDEIHGDLHTEKE